MSHIETENLLLQSRIAPSPVARAPQLQELENLATPSREQGISFTEFVEQAKAKPHLFLRNSAGFIVQAMEAAGSSKEYHYGREIPVFHAMRPDTVYGGYPASKVPRDHEETFFELHTILKDQAKLPFPNKGILLYGPPGCGKNLIIDLVLHATEDFSKFHPDGVRFRLSFKFDRQSFLGFGDHQSRNASNGQNHKDDILIASPSNTTPFALLNFEIEQARHLGDHPLFRERLRAREDLLGALISTSDGRSLNTDYAREARLGPSLKVICDNLIRHYRENERATLTEAFQAIREKHFVAQPYFFDAELGEGILSKIPLGESASDAWGLRGPFSSGDVPHPLREASREPLLISSAQLRVDVMHIEDMFHPRMDLGHMTYLHALIENGRLQIPTADPDSGSRMPTRYLTITAKDWQLLASANTQNIHNRSGEEGFEPLAERFIGLNVAHIRNYKQQAEAIRPALSLLTDGRMATPHAVEIAALFFTATRLIDPKPSYYTGEFKEAASLIAELKGGVAKALYLALKPGHGEEHILNMIARRFDGDQLKVIMRPEIRNRIAHEHVSSRRIGASASLTDGGFGISPRIVGDIFAEMLNYNPDSDLTVRDIVDYLKTREGNFSYYSALREMRTRIQKQIYVEECQKLKISPIDPMELDSASLSAKDREQIKSAWATAAKETDQRFPIAEPRDIVAEVELLAKALVREDILIGLGVNDRSSRERFTRYIMHTVSYVLGNREVPDEYRIVSRNFNDASKNPWGIDEKFMESVESDLNISLVSADEFRKAIMSAFSAGSMDCQKRAEESQRRSLTTEELFSELFVTKEFLADKLKTLKDKVASEAKSKLANFISGIPKYYNQPDMLSSDLTDPNRQEAALQWKAAWEHLKAIGYSERVMPNLSYWAIDLNSVHTDSPKKDTRGNH